MLRIPWTAYKVNEEVSRMMYTKLSLLVTAKQRKRFLVTSCEGMAYQDYC